MNHPRKADAPADYLPGLKRHWPLDLVSGFVVFLLAMPLSVGIALASGCPPTAGILAAVVGGVVGSLLGGSYLTINGPAAGLIVIVLGAVQDLGHGDPVAGYRRMLATAVLAGVLQLGMGLLRLGALGVGVPGSVIHGMLSGIGVIIIVKQLPVALGATATAKSVPAMIAEIPQLVQGLNPEVALIACVGLLIILSYRDFKGELARLIPAPLIVVIAGIGMAHLFDFDHTHKVQSHWMTFEAGPKLLLNLPSNLAAAIVRPDWSELFTWPSLRWAISLALVASIESLLTANAVDRLDPYKRVSNLDRELLTKGVCNSLCGLIGGMPIIAEIVRSSANVRAGASTRWANFFHGVFILAFLALFPALLHQIPMAALAALLLSVGYALAHPSQFLNVAKVGRDHFAAFLVTFVLTVGVDLLAGVAAGIAVELVFNLSRGANWKHLFRVAVEERQESEQRVLRVTSALVFSNFLGLKKRLEAQGGKSSLLLDLSAAPIVDHTALDHLHRLQAEAGNNFAVTFSESHRAVSQHPLATRRRTRKAR